ncbi:hypothetical protein BV210_18010 (plasmid) [Halorientalis sp. IM1011]|uniref:hypothetical protein n=1 Tax=Halorientalis sp. IM1011 TaxID=1932360 RepID=UPI00097CD60F|nr:hypothetical protein [Halorientalis sp. IM1011]AQL44661.1 hypothetical protein BV210_18010 [Halorientalis sp. IM1011]
MTGTASGYHDAYDPVNVVEAGADPNGEEPINDVLEEIAYGEDEVAIEFPPGEYRMDEQFRYTGMESFAMFGDDATIVPASGDEFSGTPRLFKLGTHVSPADWVRIQGLEFDFTAPNTGLRALQVQANDMYVANIDCLGTHDGGTWGPYLFDVTDPACTAVVRDVRAPDGGEYTENTEAAYEHTVSGGPTGMIVGPAHEGTIWFNYCELGGFPGNGLYSSAEEGTIVVQGGEYRNSNVANIRLDGHRCYVNEVSVVVDEARPQDTNQRGIRFDDGTDFGVYNTTIELSPATGEAIRVTNEAEDVTIEGVSVTIEDPDHSEEAIAVSGGASDVHIVDSDVEVRAGSQAIKLYEGDGTDPVVIENVTVTGDADGGFGGSNAIRCERDESEFHDLTVDQPGDSYRRCLYIEGEDCTVEGGEYRSTHHPIVNNATGTEIANLEAEAYNDLEGLKMYRTEDCEVHGCTIYNGIQDATDQLAAGADDAAAEIYDNTFPSS